jgi:aryl-alcohol dehydrogenase-like predicted oxidoreductase
MKTQIADLTRNDIRQSITSRRRLGHSDLMITPTGFGAWAIGGSGWEFSWGGQDDCDSIAAIHRALELGVNWIDTAAAYGLGHSEEVVARALQTWSGPRPYVFTKCGLIGDEHGNVHRSLKRDSIRFECENSLRRLRVDAIDLYQIHWPVLDSHELVEGWATMAELQREGKVRWIGVSNFDVKQMRLVQQIAPITSLQPPYSLIRREIEQEILPFCLKEEIGVIVYSPMASGLLTGAMTRQRALALPVDDWHSRDPEFREPKLSRNLELVRRLRVVGDRHGRPAGQVAIAWVLTHPAVTGAIVGARSIKQVEQIAAASELHLTQQEIDEIEGQTAMAASASN